MKKILSAVLVLVVCFTALFGLSACDGQKTEEESSATVPPVTEYVEPWKADAESHAMMKYTKFLRFASGFDSLIEYSENNPAFDPKNPFTEEAIKYETEEFDNRMATLISCFESEKNAHPFAQKYLEELGKTNYTELSDTDKFIFECYSKLLISDRVFENGSVLETDSFHTDTVEADMIDELVYASYVGTADDLCVKLWFPSDKYNNNKMYKFFADGKRILFDGMGNVSIPSDKGDETELDTESVKKIIKDNISFFEFLVEYRNTVYAHIRNTEERNKAQTVAPDFYKNLTEKNDNVFTNKFGSSDTKCVVSGCTNNIASSGDTNCCVKHSNKCGNCKCYIDGDAMFCMSCIEDYIKNN